MDYVIDRIEGDKVVVENQETFKMEVFDKDLFPEGIKDGDRVILNEGKFEIRKIDLDKLNKELEEKYKDLFGDKK